jgi:ribosome maturation factor RimP
MGTNDLDKKLEGLIKPVVESIGMELSSLELHRARGRSLLRVFIDKNGGVTMDDCEDVSREVSAILDVEDPIPGPYTLEVSSPGLDRPLKNREDFKRFAGETARIVTREPIEKQTFFVGKILRAGETDIVMLLPKDREVIIPYDIISRARLEVTI